MVQKRTISQKIGSRGHRLVMSLIEEHPDWLARGLDEDFGIDAEAELTTPELSGAILKIQIKTAERLRSNNGCIVSRIDRKYVEYAASCRYPVVFLLVDLQQKEAWFLWVQEWLLENRAEVDLYADTSASWKITIPNERTLRRGLDDPLKQIAEWRGSTQLAPSLCDALRAAAASYNEVLIEKLLDVIDAVVPTVSDISLEVLLHEAVRLGHSLRGTAEGVAISQRLFPLVRKYGHQITRGTILLVVRRGDGFSRTGLTYLGLLYDEQFDRLTTMGLPEVFLPVEPRVAWYCAFREAHPEHKSMDVCVDPKDFEHAGLRYAHDYAPSVPTNAYANRGPSALLDYLEFIE